jgi:hypothetical protein
MLWRKRSTSSLRPNRRIVTWNGRGLPSGWQASASPSRITLLIGSSRAVEFVLEGCRTQLCQPLADVFGGLRQHRLERPKPPDGHVGAPADEAIE